MNVRFPIGLADLAEALASLGARGEGTTEIARALGLRPAGTSAPESGAEVERGGEIAPLREAPEQRQATVAATLATIPVRIPASLLDAPPLEFADEELAWTPRPRPLVPRRRLVTFVRDVVAQRTPSATVDVDAVVEDLARLRLRAPLPRKMRRGLRGGVALVYDDGAGMQPFRSDAAQFGDALRRITAPYLHREYSVAGPPLDPVHGDVDRLPQVAPNRGAAVVVLTDLGIARPWSVRRAAPADWMAWAKRLTRRGYRVAAVVPYARSRWPAGARRNIDVRYWQAGYVRHRATEPETVRALCRRLSLAARIDRALVREMRVRFLPDVEAGLEADCIFGHWIAFANPHAVIFRPEALAELRAELASRPDELEETRAFLEAQRTRCGSDRLLSFEEELIYRALRRRDGDDVAVLRDLRSILRTLVERPQERRLARWAASVVLELPMWLEELDVTRALREVSRARVAGRPVERIVPMSGDSPLRIEVGPDGYTPSGVLRGEHVQAIREVLVDHGGFALIPSDTCYSLAARPTDRDIPRRINHILRRTPEPISLAFDSDARVAEWVEMTPVAARIFERLTPGAMTVVCRGSEASVARTAIEVLAAADGTIGVRIPDSLVERQLVTACDYPLTTVAIRTLDDTKRPVTDFETARRIVESGVASLGERVALAFVESRQGFLFTHSTVVRVPGRTAAYEILRQGAITRDEIERAIASKSRWELTETSRAHARELAQRILRDVRATRYETSIARRAIAELDHGVTPQRADALAAELEALRRSIERHGRERRPLPRK